MKKTDKGITEEETILKEIEDGLRLALKNKLQSYSRETSYMPFQEAILGKKNTAIYSFGISISTWLGQNLKGYEGIAKILAKAVGSEVHLQYKIPYSITKDTEKKIYEIYTSILRGEISPDANTLAKQIKKFAKGKEGIHQDSVVDVFIKDKDKNLFIFDISSPKSNMKEAKSLKLKIMNWTALGYANFKNVKSIYAFIALPYNPYHPKEYARFSTKIFDKSRDILVQDKFWDKIAGFKVYDKLIQTIQKVGTENMEDLLKKVDGL